MPRRIKIDEQTVINECLSKSYVKAAKKLGISASTCYNICRRNGISKPIGKTKGCCDEIIYKKS